MKRPLRRRRYWCPACRKYIVHVTKGQSIPSYCASTGRNVKLVWRPT